MDKLRRWLIDLRQTENVCCDGTATREVGYVMGMEDACRPLYEGAVGGYEGAALECEGDT